RIVKVRVAFIGGAPLSVTRTVTVLVLGTCAALGAHENKPPLTPIVAPPGAASRLKLSVWGGLSVSVALTVKLSVWPSVTDLSVIAARVGGVLFPPPPNVLAAPGVGVSNENRVGVPSG